MHNPSLKYLGFFYLIAAAQGLFFAFTQLRVAKRTIAPRMFLAAIIILFSLTLIESGLWWSQKMSDFVHFISIGEPIPFLFGPLVYFYFKSSFTDYRFKAVNLLHLLPFLLTFLYCSQFYFNSAAAKAAMLQGTIAYEAFFPVYVDSLYLVILMSLSHLIYSALIWKQFYYRTKALKEIRIWFFLTFGVFVFYVLNFATFHALSHAQLIGGCEDYGIAASMSIFIYLFSWFGVVRPRIFDGYSVNEALRPVISNKKNPELPPELSADILFRLNALMNKEQLYKDESIRLDTLAGKLNVSRNNLSQVINKTGMNFFEYINHWRIEEAKKILTETTKKELNVIEVAYEVGFNNKVSFNRFFKKTTGLTPTEFRKLMAEK